jgi:hypothetical protein
MLRGALDLNGVDLRTEGVYRLPELDVARHSADIDVNAPPRHIERYYACPEEVDRSSCDVRRKRWDTRLNRGNHTLLQPNPLYKLFFDVDQGHAEPEASLAEPKGGHKPGVARSQDNNVVEFTI